MKESPGLAVFLDCFQNGGDFLLLDLPDLAEEALAHDVEDLLRLLESAVAQLLKELLRDLADFFSEQVTALCVFLQNPVLGLEVGDLLLRLHVLLFAQIYGLPHIDWNLLASVWIYFIVCGF